MKQSHGTLALLGLWLSLPFASAYAQEGDQILSQVLIDQLENRWTDDGHALRWDGQGWIGGDFNKLWIKSEGLHRGGKTDEAQIEALYDRAITPFWDLQVGLRHDARPTPTQNWAAFGVQGLTPYLFDIEATAYIGEGGRTAARFKAFYGLLFTQRLILEPQIEANAYGQDDGTRGIGSGLSDLEVALRLRYEIHRELAPYIGVVWRQKYGHTADYAHANGESTADTMFVAGVRMWY